MDTPTPLYVAGPNQSSGLSWAAIFAGATCMAALSMLLLILGVGLKLSDVSPWDYSTELVSTSTIVWVSAVQLISAAVGGYLAGRLRVRWPGVDHNEAYFRDTAQGLLSWALASLLTLGLLTGSVHKLLTAAAPAAIEAATEAAPNLAYFSDLLLRDTALTEPEASERIQRLLAVNLAQGSLAPEDRAYLSALLSNAQVPALDAEQRVDRLFARLEQAQASAKAQLSAQAEQAAKAGARTSLWMFVALLAGAFTASLMATFGGRQRDELPSETARAVL